MMYSTVACTAIRKDHAENTIPLSLFTGHILVAAGCCDYTILALGKYATIYIYFCPFTVAQIKTAVLQAFSPLWMNSCDIQKSILLWTELNKLLLYHIFIPVPPK
jgi:hypothetical protein